ncbi:MAG: DNA mismatch repair protein MutS, partial [Alphaproteobacteria bacterium]|nr:DNA mismatch repair protein MutS [Alphaproteobacteria bacterium]
MDQTTPPLPPDDTGPPEAALAEATPVMAQFLRLKAEHPDFLLFFRMGDFYELFFEDAVEAAAALDIALTRRGRHQGEDIPMCGVPAERADPYLEKLIRKGFRVAIAEQIEDPAEARKRGAKAVVARAVVRLVTAGTLTEEALLEARAPNYLAALALPAKGGPSLAWLDLSTGELGYESLSPGEVMAALARLDPAEILIPDGAALTGPLAPLAGEMARKVVLRPPASFAPKAAERRLLSLYGVATLDGLGRFGEDDLSALGALADYVELTQKGARPALCPPRPHGQGATVLIDAATRANLELAQTARGARGGSLLAAIDETVTAGGGRLLARWLQAPLTDLAAITGRHDAVGWLVDRPDLRGALRARLRRMPDVERALQRVLMGRGGPRDLGALRDGLTGA